MKRKIMDLVKRLLKKNPLYERIVEQDVARRILDSFPVFKPNSSGSFRQLANLTVLAAQQIFPFLCELLSSVSVCHGEEASIESICDGEDAKIAANELKVLFNKHGSDKSVAHNYHWLYGKILQNPPAIHNILEIGLGTSNMDVVSNMGVSGKPGASLRAFREFLPNATIYGADIDRRILFKEDRIKTFFVDQTNPDSLQELAGVTPDTFDLIIDDGLHAPNANIAALTFALKKLKEGGWFVVEDISVACRPIWRLVASILPSKYRTLLLTAEGGLLFAVERLCGSDRTH